MQLNQLDFGQKYVFPPVKDWTEEFVTAHSGETDIQNPSKLAGTTFEVAERPTDRTIRQEIRVRYKIGPTVRKMKIMPEIFKPNVKFEKAETVVAAVDDALAETVLPSDVSKKIGKYVINAGSKRRTSKRKSTRKSKSRSRRSRNSSA